LFVDAHDECAPRTRSSSSFFSGSLAASQGTTPAERRAWQDGIYCARKRRIIEAGIGYMSAAEDAKWSVSLLNDDTTPMDFVVDVIEQVFDIDLENARHLMLRVHNEGGVECGAYSQEIAKAKAAQVMDLARVHRHPLQCVVERKP
jgi:ATP-dependent Clp protease adaptor protein ClpS